MERDPRAYLWEVPQAAEAILTFTAGLDFAAYAQSELVRSAVERKFEIIGEALGQLSKYAPDLAARVTHSRRVVDFRNQLIHGYHQVKHDIVWHTVQTELPALRAEATLLLDELGPA